MNWKTKAAIMRLFAALSYGDRIYKAGQKRFGRLAARPMTRLPKQAQMIRWLRDAGRSVEGMRFFELGTGHVPLVPIGFYLCGADKVLTVDLNRRIDWNLTRDSLYWISKHREDVWALYNRLVPEAVFNVRFAVLARLADDPPCFLDAAGIDYKAPMNAADTRLADHSIDCCFSMTTLEHIRPKDIRDIFVEAKRILNKGGTSLHFVDMSDHFQHQDTSISRINFLQYSERQWQRIAGNEFAYCNRMRVSDYVKIFDELGYKIERQENIVDQEAVIALREGKLKIDPAFSGYDQADLCSTSLRVLLGLKS